MSLPISNFTLFPTPSRRLKFQLANMKLSAIIQSASKIILSLFLTVFLILNLAIPSISQDENSVLPPGKIYPLPESLQNWQSENQEDYFSLLDSHPVGALIWYDFPVKVYIQSPSSDLSASGLQAFQQWQTAVKEAMALWHPFIPMKEVYRQEEADIIITRQPPAIKAEINPETGLYNLPRNPAATTRVSFYFSEDNPPILKHKMAIEVSPHQTLDYLISNISHEMGHALGIWGHSDNPNDIMYYAHTRDIPTISSRDINTLKRVYQQPTRLGMKWSNE